MILIAYDGSDDAKAAIAQAGTLFPGQAATVLTVWEHFVDTMTRAGGLVLLVDYEEVDGETQKAAIAKAEEGAALAREAGLKADARTAVAGLSIADAILSEAGAMDAAAVVCGSRGYTGVKSLLLGSISRHVLQHADRPVVVVPSPEVVRARAEHRASLS